MAILGNSDDTNLGAPPESHYDTVVNKLRDGRVTPFLGAGANLCDSTETWDAQLTERPPSGKELADYLVVHVLQQNYSNGDLLRISQFIENGQGPGPLYQELDELFLRRRYAPTTLHRWLAGLLPASHIRDQEIDQNLLIVTTNYDCIMEDAFGERDYDLLFYLPEESGPGAFWHVEPNGAPRAIKAYEAQTYDYPFFEERPVILKIHGTAHPDESYSHYVITEDNYIQYVAERPLQNLLPRRVLKKLQRSHILYLGYSLADWNLRVFLHMIGQQPRNRYRGWAVNNRVEEDDRLAWRKREVDVFRISLLDYVQEIQVRLGIP